MKFKSSPSDLILFYLVTLPMLLGVTFQYLGLIFSVSSTTMVEQPAGSGDYPQLFGDLLDDAKIPNEFELGEGKAPDDIFASYVTQAVGKNFSNAIREFLHSHPLPPVLESDEDNGIQLAGKPVLYEEEVAINGDDEGLLLVPDAAVRRRRRYVIRNPNDLNYILAEMSTARNFTELTGLVKKLAGFFWYGEWCGAGWSKIKQSAEPNECCRCRNGAKSVFVDKTLIRNTANDCIKCGSHPIDPVDTGCMLHDICYTCTQSPFGSLMAHCECERIISQAAKAADCTRSVSRLYPEMNETMRYRWCSFYKGAIPLLFENKPCYCPRNGQPFVAFSLSMCDRGHLLVPVKA